MNARIKKLLVSLLGATALITCTYARIDLDSEKLKKRAYPTYIYDPEQSELDITLHNVGVVCETGKRPTGRRLGTYPNPDFQVFEEDFEHGGQSPHCIVYKISS